MKNGFSTTIPNVSIWWNEKGVLYYELLKLNQTVIADRYVNEINRLRLIAKDLGLAKDDAK